MSLSSVGSDHVPDGGTAEGALAGAVKLLHGAAEAHAHVPAAVQHTVHVGLVAHHAFVLHHAGHARVPGDVEGGVGGRGAGLGSWGQFV